MATSIPCRSTTSVRSLSCESTHHILFLAGNREWSILPTSGYHVKGGFGHSSVFDEGSNLIYVYGGYVSTMSTNAAISNELYTFDPITRIW